MCHPLILASVQPLPIWQYAPHEEDKDDGQIYVENCKAKSRDEQMIFAARHPYYVSTRQTGDACGFTGSYKKAHDARRDLATFLERSLERATDLQLYVADTYFGKSGVNPTKLDYIGPSDIRTWISGFVVGDLFQVIPED